MVVPFSELFLTIWDILSEQAELAVANFWTLSAVMVGRLVTSLLVGRLVTSLLVGRLVTSLLVGRQVTSLLVGMLWYRDIHKAKIIIVPHAMRGKFVLTALSIALMA